MKKPFSKLFGLKNKDDLLTVTDEDKKGVQSINIEKIVPNRYQPRQKFDTARIEELAESIRAHGLLQPIVVRPIEENMYEIIAGERRFRALQMNQMTDAEVLVRHLDDEETAVVALIENIQRENLSAVEEAEAYKKLLAFEGITQAEVLVRHLDDEETAVVALIENIQRENLSAVEEAEAYKKLLAFEGITQAELAKSVGKSQSFIANKLRLLKLTPVVLEAVRDHQITERHARALVGQTPEFQEEMLGVILKEQLNVKQTEERLKATTVKDDVVEEKVVARPPEFAQDVSEARDIIADSLMEIRAQTEERLKATTVKDDVVEEKVVARPPEFAQDVSEARDIIADSLMEIRANGIRYEQKEKEHEDYVEIQIRLYRK